MESISGDSEGIGLKNANGEQIENSKSKSDLFKAGNEDALFDQIIEEVGNDGPFQRRLDVLFNFVFIIPLSMTFMNLMLSMTVTDHWCHVPGLEKTNYTLEEWKEKWLPRTSETGRSSYSSCQMFARNGTNNVTVDCLYGWDYDRNWYTQTIPTEGNWVCDKESYVSNTFVVDKVGDIVGTFIFGQLGDRLGRKPVYYLSVTILTVGRLLLVFTSGSYIAFLSSIGLGSLATMNFFQSPLVMSMEVSCERKRSYIVFLQSISWVAGLCLLAFLAWLLTDWKLIILVTTLPNIACLVMHRLLPESPRWLASRGRVEDAVKVLKYIAKVNNSRLPKDTFEVLERIRNKEDKLYGLASLFLNWRLAKNTIVIVTSWTVCSVCYYVITLKVTGMSGNPFLNFFYQALVELPAYVVAKILSDRIGRRWTQTGAFAVGGLFCCGTLLVQTFDADDLVIVFVALNKLALTTSFYMVWLQAIEIYPTPLRQTGTSLASAFAGIIGVSGPYIVFLGTPIDKRLPFVILLALILLGCVSSSFLPETLHEKLPETLEDAKTFGKNQKYWSLSSKKIESDESYVKDKISYDDAKADH